MNITKKEFAQRLKAGQLAICLIGMSGIGKTYRSLQLKKLGFRHICCDKLIAKHLNLPTKEKNLALWMGQPYAPGYTKRAQKYLRQEAFATQKALRHIKHNTIIDTTGSVIYLSEKIQKLLKKSTLIVYLQANQTSIKQLFKVYTTNPKPVIWGNQLQKQKSETSQMALTRCYPKLLRFRAKKYKKLADITLPFSVIYNYHSTSRQFLTAIKNQLKNQ